MKQIIQIPLSEVDYIQACADNHEWALKKLYEDHYSVMLPVCMRYANNNDDALDILHEGFIKVFRYMKKYKPGTSLGSWIRRIMINTSIDYYRKEKRRRSEDLDSVFDLSCDTPSVVDDLSAEDIINALQCISPAYRSVFNLYVIEGYSHKEVAEKLDITESTSRSNLVKARSKLKKILKSKGIER